MKKNNHSNLNCPDDDTAAKLRELTSTIAHARQVESDMEAITRSLKERSVNPEIYQIDTCLDTNVAHLEEIFADSNDIHIRELFIMSLQRRAVIVFVESMTDQAIINGHIMAKLTMPPITGLSNPIQEPTYEYLKNTLVTAASVMATHEMKAATKRVLSGDTALFVDGLSTVLIIATRKLDSRPVSDPQTESDISGPRDGFTEELRTNVTLVRRRIKNPNLVVKRVTVGQRSETDVAIVYFRGIVNMKLVHEVEQRLKNLNVDDPTISGLKGLLEDHPHSPFPTILTTERPDKFTTALLMGKVGVIIDGTPYCLILPAAFSDFFQAGDDFFQKWQIGTLTRISRYIAAFLGLSFPAFYVAVTSFHPAFLPTPLALIISTNRESLPFPVFIETLIMVIVLEIMQEAGIRLPKTVGSAVSIVGGLVIGDASVRAGLVSPPIVIVTSFTAIASFTIVHHNMGLPLRLLRFMLMMMGASFGLFGVMIGLLAIAIHLANLESLGEPYLAPMAPRNFAALRDLKATSIIVPPKTMDRRPAYLETEDSVRQNTDKE
ncbi:spore germination protein [Pelosinus sp. sgz500959]|uniref:spore germination protein n=1 Tax=Pelosinus sp. sgz500959 TaxID=3242472 RepID=UPI00366EE980